MTRFKNIILLIFASFIGANGFYPYFFMSLPIMPLLGLTIIFYIISAFNLGKDRSSFKEQIGYILILQIFFLLFGTNYIPYSLKAMGLFDEPQNYFMTFLFSLTIFPPLSTIFFINQFIIKKIVFFRNIRLFNCFTAGAMTITEQYFPIFIPIRIGNSWIELAPYISPAKVFGP
ncbi:MAG: hypothetical protein HOJ35_10625, partial [Bdellovibrionales bacterium]|nr:hypothetical protein [Bdellovibrionales bacterium]